MPYEYSNPKRENDPHALPNIWIFEDDVLSVSCPRCKRENDETHWPACIECGTDAEDITSAEDDVDLIDGPTAIRTGNRGFFWAFCLPGCMPDSSFSGPFETYEAALADARDQANDGLDDDESEDA